MFYENDPTYEPERGYFKILTEDVMRCRSLEPNAKLLYADITSLCREKGYCYASNRYLAKLYEVDERTIKRWIKSLEVHEFIFIDCNRNGFQTIRRIFLSEKLKEKFTEGQKCHPGGAKMSSSKGQNCHPNKISKNIIEEQQQPAAPAAVFSSQKEAKQKPKAPAAPKVYECLEPLEIPLEEKVWISSKYDLDAVAHAVSYATHPTTKITTTFIQTIKWACKEQPDIPISKEDAIEKNRKYAERYDDKKTKLASIAACSKYVEVISGGVYGSTVILYEDKSFMEQFQNALRKNGFSLI